MRIFSIILCVMFGFVVFSGFYIYCVTHPWTNSYMSKQVSYVMRDKILKHLIVDIAFFIIAIFLTSKGRYKANIVVFACAIAFYTINYILMHKHG